MVVMGQCDLAVCRDRGTTYIATVTSHDSVLTATIRQDRLLRVERGPADRPTIEVF
jgi:hypothetical protein